MVPFRCLSFLFVPFQLHLFRFIPFHLISYHFIRIIPFRFMSFRSILFIRLVSLAEYCNPTDFRHMQVVMSNVRCTGREKKFSNCAFSQPRNCDHYHDAAVRCNAPKLQGHKVLRDMCCYWRNIPLNTGLKKLSINTFDITLKTQFIFKVEVHANGRNIVGQQHSTLLGPTCCVRLRGTTTMLHLLALVAYSSKPVKPLGPCKRTQHFCMRSEHKNISK